MSALVDVDGQPLGIGNRVVIAMHVSANAYPMRLSERRLKYNGLEFEIVAVECVARYSGDTCYWWVKPDMLPDDGHRGFREWPAMTVRLVRRPAGLRHLVQRYKQEG